MPWRYARGDHLACVSRATAAPADVRRREATLTAVGCHGIRARADTCGATRFGGALTGLAAVLLARLPNRPSSALHAMINSYNAVSGCPAERGIVRRVGSSLFTRSDACSSWEVFAQPR